MNHESDEAADALFWTGGVPYELDELWKQPVEGLMEKTVLYRRQRVDKMVQRHGKFFDTLVDRERDNVDECISRMALGLPPPPIRVGMDQQLFHIIKDDAGHETITARNPVAREALLLFHGKHLVTPLGIVASLEFRGGHDAKERIVGKYITTMVELSNQFLFTSRRFTKTGLLTVKPTQKEIRIEDVLHFSGNKLPNRNLFKSRAITLFVPQSPNYPGFDFFIWNSLEKVLMAFQVSVVQPFTSHPNIEGAGENCKLWLEFCFDASAKKAVEVYWIIPRSCVGKPKNFQDSVILFEDLEDLPALKQLTV